MKRASRKTSPKRKTSQKDGLNGSVEHLADALGKVVVEAVELSQGKTQPSLDRLEAGVKNLAAEQAAMRKDIRNINSRVNKLGGRSR